MGKRELRTFTEEFKQDRFGGLCRCAATATERIAEFMRKPRPGLLHEQSRFVENCLAL